MNKLYSHKKNALDTQDLTQYLQIHAPDTLTAPCMQRQINEDGSQPPSGKQLTRGGSPTGSAFSTQDAEIFINPDTGAIVSG